MHSEHQWGDQVPLCRLLSPFFQALFKPAFLESTTRIVEVDLPSVKMLEPTLLYLYAGAWPKASDHLDPNNLFGLLLNAQYLLLDELVEHCCKLLIQLFFYSDCTNYTSHPSFCPQVFPVKFLIGLLRLLEDEEGEEGRELSSSVVGEEGNADEFPQYKERGGHDEICRALRLMTHKMPAKFAARLLNATFDWLKDVDQTNVGKLPTCIPYKDFAMLVIQVEKVAGLLDFEALATLHRGRPREFQMVLGHEFLLAPLVAFELEAKEHKEQVRIQKYVCLLCMCNVCMSVFGVFANKWQ